MGVRGTSNIERRTLNAEPEHPNDEWNTAFFYEYGDRQDACPTLCGRSASGRGFFCMAMREVAANPLLEGFEIEINHGRDVKGQHLRDDEAADDGEAERAAGF